MEVLNTIGVDCAAPRDRVCPADLLAAGDLRVDIPMRRVWLGSKELQLPPKEFELLTYLIQNRSLVLSRDQLLKDF